ncbi:MAG: sigma-54-dependent Fis family transcriptional regulator [Deltaproteobacteria bacterium]|nr:sigma-54-dependent Fis family transcriptional regulator [Deltaproteobacteria bacterium]
MLNAALKTDDSGCMPLAEGACEHLSSQTEPYKYGDIIGSSRGMKEIYSLIERVADSESTVVITGESGTGKGMVARAIHNRSNRREKPFITINCGAIPENLLESELFGHVRGAFTGASSNKPGKFELAKGGTIFLDEIGDMSTNLQVKILRVLEEREFEQVGGSKTLHADVRIIAATHANLEEQVEKGEFREDLFYRLYVVPIEVPALRERRSDIPQLVSHFLDEFNRKSSRDVEGVSQSALKAMEVYTWPGNVRELKNVMERLVVLKREGCIEPQDLPGKLKKGDFNPEISNIRISEEGINLNSAVTEFEKALILESLNRTKWIKNQAAKLLQLNRTTLVEKIKRHKLEPQIQ